MLACSRSPSRCVQLARGSADRRPLDRIDRRRSHLTPLRDAQTHRESPLGGTEADRRGLSVRAGHVSRRRRAHDDGRLLRQRRQAVRHRESRRLNRTPDLPQFPKYRRVHAKVQLRLVAWLLPECFHRESQTVPIRSQMSSMPAPRTGAHSRSDGANWRGHGRCRSCVT